MGSQNRSGRWADLRLRIFSAALLAMIGLGAVISGGVIFKLLVIVSCGLMAWELSRLQSNAPGHNIIAAACAGLFLGLTLFQYPNLSDLIILFFSGVAIAGLLFSLARPFWLGAVLGAAVILGAGASLVHIRDALGVGWLLWLLSIVIVTDVFGYFFGRMIGGRLLWPAVSPSKTWSGTIAGWLGAGLIGALFGLGSDMWLRVVALSVLFSIAAQLGDLGESALKRRAGVKDSSQLIPGHGGLMDRFDGLVGASIAMLLVLLVFDFPW